MNNVEMAINVFTVDKGEVKILLTRKKEEPYKNYWQPPKADLLNGEFENTLNFICENVAGVPKTFFHQISTMTDFEKHEGNHFITISYLSVIDAKTLEIKFKDTGIEKAWFSIKNVPKMAYSYEKVVKDGITHLRNKLVNSTVLKSLFPSDFTLPELQAIYELILDKELDRRNFRKKFLTFDLIEDTGYKNEGFNGRPAKLYCFKTNIKEIDLF